MVIIENDKDRRSLQWLLEQHGQAKIDEAANAIAGRGQKPYTTMVAKHLGTRIPQEVWGMQSGEKSAIRGNLQALRDEFAERVAKSKESKVFSGAVSQ